MSDTTDLLQTERADSAGSADVSTSTGAAAGAARKRKPAGLPSMVLPELQTLASQLGISGTGRMRKSELIAAIQEHQTGSSRPARTTPMGWISKVVTGRVCQYDLSRVPC